MQSQAKFQSIRAKISNKIETTIQWASHLSNIAKLVSERLW